MTSYIPLYRKYRPQAFSDLVGQEVLVKTLTNAINTNKLSHAYLLTGPRGTGKTSTARILAKSLNCQEGPTVTPCGKCNNCVDLVNGSAIDVIEIDAASNNSVEDARNILEKVQFVPVSGKYKIYIIDEVHMLSTQAFNTLLKTLEEPPDNLVFILATTEPHKVLDTIISRCQRFDFRRITTDDIVKRLEYIAKKEGFNIEPQALSLIARKSLGGLRDALALLDQVSVIQSENAAITQDDVIKIIGAISQEALFEIADLIANKDTASIITLINNLSQRGNEPQIIIKEVIGYFRNLLILNSLPGLNDEVKKITLLSDEIVSDVFEQSKKFELNEIVQIIEKLSEYELNIKNTTNPYLWLEVGLISITNRENITIISNLEKRLAALEAGSPISTPVSKQPPIINNKPEPVIQTPTIKQSEVKAEKKVEVKIEEPKEELVFDDNVDDYEQEPVIENPVVEKQEPVQNSDTLSDIKQNWGDLLGNIESVPSRMFFLNLAKPVKISKEQITIAFKNDTFVKQAKDSNKIDPLKKAAIKLLGGEPRVSIIAADESQKVETVESPTVKEGKKPAKPKQKIETVEKVKQEESSEPVVIKEPQSVNKVYSDEESNVMNLFNGKVLT